MLIARIAVHGESCLTSSYMDCCRSSARLVHNPKSTDNSRSGSRSSGELRSESTTSVALGRYVEQNRSNRPQSG
jgi:hypothetical protein